MKPKIPNGRMTVAKARQRWNDVRKAARTGDPAQMADAVSRFETLAEMIIASWAEKKGQPHD